MLGGNGFSLEPAWTCRFGLKSTRPDSKRNVPSSRSVAGRAASPALCSFFEKLTPRRSASSLSPASRMMYHAGFRPEEVFTAPLNKGSVIVPLGVPGGTFTLISFSIGMSNLPDFSNWTGPASIRERVGRRELFNIDFRSYRGQGRNDVPSGSRLIAAGPGPFP